MTPRLPAVVTAAGDGTRFRPFTQYIPKEMLPIGSRPALGHVITECLAAGADHVYVVTRPGDHIVPTYVADLHEKGLPVSAIAEDRSLGYGNAAPILTLTDHLAQADIFLVAFGDDILLERAPGTALTALCDLAHDADAAIAAQLIDHNQIHAFGAIEVSAPGANQVARIRQRPDPATVTEPLALVSRLVLRPQVLKRLTARPGADGEVDLGLAVSDLARIGDVRVHRIAGQWVTVGDPRRYADALRRWHEHTTGSGDAAC